MSFAGRLRRSRVIHFALAGALLFAARGLLTSEESARPERAPIDLSQERIRALEAEFVARWGAAPGNAQRRALIDQAAQEEMLYREARFLALDLDDGSVRRRLVEKMRWVSDRPGRGDDELVREARELGFEDDAVIRRLLAEKMRLLLQQESAQQPVRDEDLTAYLERHREEFRQPARVSFTQVFLSEDARGEELAAIADEVLARLRSTPPDEGDVAALTDPFPLGLRQQARSLVHLQGRFGKSFAEQVFALETGTWSGPIASPYGVHLVRVDEKRPALVPSLEDLRPALSRGVLRDRGRGELAGGLARLKNLYEVRIAESEPADATRTAPLLDRVARLITP